jgi:hypothetical protein
MDIEHHQENQEGNFACGFDLLPSIQIQNDCTDFENSKQF